jgi:EAL domain-containing protein (putative c-di-GMP-specific phosphodiesterase class I)
MTPAVSRAGDERRTLRVLAVERASLDREGGPRTFMASSAGARGFAFHVVNAFEEGDDRIAVDVAWAPHFPVLPSPRGEIPSSFIPPRLTRLDVKLEGSTLDVTPTSALFEIPEIDPRVAGAKHRVAWGLGGTSTLSGITRWEREASLRIRDFAPEVVAPPLFLSDPSGAEGAGWILTTVYVPRTHTSELLLLDATTLRTVARAPLPHVLPPHFHGCWVPTPSGARLVNLKLLRVEKSSETTATPKRVSCRECASGVGLDFEFTMAFQPFAQVGDPGVFGYEALVRGPAGEGAAEILAKVNDSNRYRFDQACRVEAIRLASQLGLQGILSINFLPNAIYRPETCIRATLEAADAVGFDRSRLMFEVTEGEPLAAPAHLRAIFAEYKKQGLKTAIDDFGAGYAGLNMLAEFQPDYIKLDMSLTRNVDTDPVRQAIVSGVTATCRSLGLQVIAEGIESAAELRFLRSREIKLFQGYLFARPGLRTLPEVSQEGRRLLDERAPPA